MAWNIRSCLLGCARQQSNSTVNFLLPIDVVYTDTERCAGVGAEVNTVDVHRNANVVV